MAHVYEEGNVNVHIASGEREATAICYDKRDSDFRTYVRIDLFSFLPFDYGQEHEDYRIPHWKFVIEAISSCANHEEELWRAWKIISQDRLY